MSRPHFTCNLDEDIFLFKTQFWLSDRPLTLYCKYIFCGLIDEGNVCEYLTKLRTKQSWIAYPPPRLWTSSHGEQHLAIREAIPHFFYTNCLKCFFFCEIEKVSRCLKCNVLLLKHKTKSHKTTKRKHVIILVTIDGLISVVK